jgi:transposase, IS5 family
VTETKPDEHKSNAGRKPYDTILKFKIMVLQSLHNLSDDRTEYLIRDRISFMRFLDLELEDPVPPQPSAIRYARGNRPRKD